MIKLIKEGTITDLEKYINEKRIKRHFDEFLISSSGYNRLDFVEYLITKDIVDINYQSYSNGNRNALMYACMKNHIEIIEYLLISGADVNAQDSTKHTAVFLTLKSQIPTDEMIRIIELLCSFGADLNIKSKYDGFPLLFVINNINDFDDSILYLLLELGADPNVELNEDDDDESILISACSSDNHKSTEILLNYGADPNYLDSDGETALFKSKSKEMINLLINHGADVNIQDNYGYTALMEFCRKENSLEIVKILINSGTNVNFTGESGHNALMIACLNNYNSIAKLLIPLTTNINAQNDEGDSALHLSKSLEITNSLIHTGADISLLNRYHETPIMVAINKSLKERFDIVKLYISIAKNDKKLIDKLYYTESNNGDNIGTISSRLGYKNIIIYLLDNGFNKNKITSKYYTIYNQGNYIIRDYLKLSKYRHNLLELSPKKLMSDVQLILISKKLEDPRALELFQKHYANDLL